MNSAGYIFITWACKMSQNSNLADTFASLVEFARSHKNTEISKNCLNKVREQCTYQIEAKRY